MPKLRPYSGPNKFAKIDGRTWEGKLLRRVREELVAHVGGRPTVVQQALIGRAAWLTLRLELLDRHTTAGQFTQHDADQYLAWSNSLARTLVKIGTRSNAPPPPSLAAHLAQRAAAA